MIQWEHVHWLELLSVMAASLSQVHILAMKQFHNQFQ